MTAASESIATAAVLVGLMALPAASQNLAEQDISQDLPDSFESSSEEPVKISSRRGPENFVKTVSTAFDRFKQNISGNSSYSVLETPDSRIETSKEPGKTVKTLETDEGLLKKTYTAESEIVEVETPEGRLVKKTVDGEKVTEFEGMNLTAVESKMNQLNQEFMEKTSEIDERTSLSESSETSDSGSETESDIELYIQPDTDLGSGEYIEIRNLEEEDLNITDWRVEDSHNVDYVFDQALISPGESIRLYTENIDADYNWDRGRAVWNENGETAYLYDESGQLITEHSY